MKLDVLSVYARREFYKTDEVRLGGPPEDEFRAEKGGWSKYKVVQQKDSLFWRQDESVPCTAYAALYTERSHSLPELLT